MCGLLEVQISNKASRSMQAWNGRSTMNEDIDILPTRWAPTSCKWGYNNYKWPYKWVTGVITLLIGFITSLITGRGPPCIEHGDFPLPC